MSQLGTLLSAGGIGRAFFCHVRLFLPDTTSAFPAAASILAEMEQALGPVEALVAWRRGGASGVRHLLVQARYAGGGLSELQLRLGDTAAARLEAMLEGPDGSVQLDGAGTLWRHTRTGLEAVPAGPATAPPAAPDRLLSMLRAEERAAETAMATAR